jgi:hypothetical protein
MVDFLASKCLAAVNSQVESEENKYSSDHAMSVWITGSEVCDADVLLGRGKYKHPGNQAFQGKRLERFKPVKIALYCNLTLFVISNRRELKQIHRY